MFLKEYIEQGANDRNFNKQQAKNSGGGDAWTRLSGNNLNPIKPKKKYLTYKCFKSFLSWQYINVCNVTQPNTTCYYVKQIVMPSCVCVCVCVCVCMLIIYLWQYLWKGLDTLLEFVSHHYRTNKIDHIPYYVTNIPAFLNVVEILT